MLVLLDSNHTKTHVLAELNAYSSLVTPGSYIVSMDGIMRQVADLPRGKPEWTHDNPIEAVNEFLASDSRFELVEPVAPFNEGEVTQRVTYWPSAFLVARLDLSQLAWLAFNPLVVPLRKDGLSSEDESPTWSGPIS